ncbi:hypothetical protein Barb7_01557 [Bacteroidales bacterium Barb7]|nr:hypothetical protein Barb7_01557 [Bacteroidales bacterium Barb7]
MSTGIKRLAKETAIYGLPSILGRFLNWLLVPMYVRVLSGTGKFMLSLIPKAILKYLLLNLCALQYRVLWTN